MEIATKFIIPGILYLASIATGFWLSHLGRPLNMIVFNVHKLIALAAVIFMVVRFFEVQRPGGAQPLVIVLSILSAILIIALFASGAMLSQDKPAMGIYLIVHLMAPFLELFGMVGVVILLASKF